MEGLEILVLEAALELTQMDRAATSADAQAVVLLATTPQPRTLVGQGSQAKWHKHRMVEQLRGTVLQPKDLRLLAQELDGNLERAGQVEAEVLAEGEAMFRR